jgi:hypothetical protein
MTLKSHQKPPRTVKRSAFRAHERSRAQLLIVWMSAAALP